MREPRTLHCGYHILRRKFKIPIFQNLCCSFGLVNTTQLMQLPTAFTFTATAVFGLRRDINESKCPMLMVLILVNVAFSFRFQRIHLHVCLWACFCNQLFFSYVPLGITLGVCFIKYTEFVVQFTCCVLPRAIWFLLVHIIIIHWQDNILSSLYYYHIIIYSQFYETSHTALLTSSRLQVIPLGLLVVLQSALCDGIIEGFLVKSSSIYMIV